MFPSFLIFYLVVKGGKDNLGQNRNVPVN